MLRIVLVLVFAATAAQANDSFCKGWEVGYGAGYCYQKYSCLEPLAPLCPMQGLKDRDGYSGGYNRGFVAGQAKRSERDAVAPSYSTPSTSYATPDLAAGGASIAQAIEGYKATKQREEANEMSAARFRAEMAEKSAEFSREFPDEPNPYQAEIDKMRAEKRAEARRAAEAQEQMNLVLFGLLIGGAILLLLVMGSD